MLAALVLAGIVAAPLGSASMFIRARRRTRTAGLWATSRRLVMTLAGTAVLAAVAVEVVRLTGATTPQVVACGAGLIAVSLAWIPATRRWRARAHLCWASSVFLFVTYLVFALNWTITSHMSPANTAGGLILWALELCAAILSAAYLWEICDALGTEHWRRRITPAVTFSVADADLPFVSLHVPAHNEPPDMVIDTLNALARLDYPRYEIIVIDDNTDDEDLWRPVEAWCASHSVTFAHLQDWPGYKAGALNYALRNLTDPRAELIGVVDSDYQIEPGFLRRCAPAFAHPQTGFVQAPQDYRDWKHAPYYRRLYYSYAYFFAVSQPSRNERDGAIFAGTMGLIRRAALDKLGGWDEWCITEDAELSLRLLRAGWNGLHVDQTWGRGIMPLTFEALKGQRYRWCFGGIQILRMHWRSLLPGRVSAGNRMSAAQRAAYLAGAIQWYGDLLGLVFLVFLLAGAADMALGGGALFRKLTPFLVATVPVLVGLGLVRAVALLRRGTGASLRDAIGAFFIWQSTSLVVARASVLALFARHAAFLRTPKTSERQRWWEALRANWAESALATAGAAGIAGALSRSSETGGPLLAALLFVPTLGLAAAPVNSWAAQRAALPAWLRQRRRTEHQRERRAVRASVAAGGLATTVGATLAALALGLSVANGPVVSVPSLLDPGSARAHGTSARTGARHQPAGGPQQAGSPAPVPSPTSSPGAGISVSINVPPLLPKSPLPLPSVSLPVPVPTPSLPVPVPSVSLPVPVPSVSVPVPRATVSAGIAGRR